MTDTYDEAVERRARAIELSNGGETIIDAEDFDQVTSAGNWFKLWKGSGFYVARGFGSNNRVYLHRFITNAPPSFVVDHINGDTLDNRRANLRVVTQVENQRNRATAQVNSLTGILGVSWHKQRRKWHARISHNRKKIHLGLFENLEDAIEARRSAERDLWSEQDNYRRNAALAAGAIRKDEK